MELRGKLLLNPRMRYLYQQAYDEDNKKFPSELDENIKPVCLIYPRTFVEKIRSYHKTENDKERDYNFIGTYYRKKVAKRRYWIKDFAKKYFTNRSYLLITDAQTTKKSYVTCGDYDVSLSYSKPFVPHGKKNTCTFFDENYYKTMANSKFTLCPAGDAEWTMRFSEAVMCKSIPIVEKFTHTGRNDLERSIGYKFFYINDEHKYNDEIVNHNYELFMKNQTVMM